MTDLLFDYMQSTVLINKLLCYNLAHLSILSQEQLLNEQRTLNKLAHILQKIETNNRYELIYIKTQVLTELTNDSSASFFLEPILLKINTRLKNLNY